MILLHGTTELTIPDGEFWWSDEFSFEPLAQTTELTVGGDLIVDQWAVNTGRPITLAPHSDAHGWLLRADWQTLNGWRALADTTFILRGLGADRTVIFGRPALETQPVHSTDRQADEWWRGLIRLLEV